MSAPEPGSGPGHAFASPEHALLAGMVFGAAAKAGLDPEPVMDAEGYTADIVIRSPILLPSVTLRLVAHSGDGNIVTVTVLAPREEPHGI